MPLFYLRIQLFHVLVEHSCHTHTRTLPHACRHAQIHISTSCGGIFQVFQNCMETEEGRKMAYLLNVKQYVSRSNRVLYLFFQHRRYNRYLVSLVLHLILEQLISQVGIICRYKVSICKSWVQSCATSKCYLPDPHFHMFLHLAHEMHYTTHKFLLFPI